MSSCTKHQTSIARRDKNKTDRVLSSPVTFPVAVPLVRVGVASFEVEASAGAGAAFFPRPLLRPPPPPDEDDAEARLPPARERLRPAAVAARAAASSSSAPPSWYWAAFDRSPWIDRLEWRAGGRGEEGKREVFTRYIR